IATHRASPPAGATKPAPVLQLALATPSPPAPIPAAKPAPWEPMASPSPIPRATGNAGHPAWEQYAKATPEPAGRPEIAIVIDDMGLDRRDSARVIELPAGITIAFMTYAKDLPRQAAAARAAGHELWLHVPMEPLDRGLDAGPNALKTELTPEENR